MNPEEIRVEDPKAIKSLMEKTLSSIAEHKNALDEDLVTFDEVGQLCEMAKQAVLSRGEELVEEAQITPRQDGENHRRLQRDIDECRETMAKLVQYSEEVEGFKRDTSDALSCAQAIFDDATVLKGRVDALMDFYVDSR